METLSIKTTPDLKTAFENSFNKSGLQSKTDFFDELIKHYQENPPQAPAPTLEDDQEPETVAASQEPEPKNQFEEITLKLNPVQAFAIRETVLSPEFIRLTNEMVEKVNKGKGNGFFSDIFTGVYAGCFNEMNLERENPEAINSNMAAALVNLFMAHLIAGTVDLESHVTKQAIKDFLQEPKEEANDETPLY
jgi:hypothetical protein